VVFVLTAAGVVGSAIVDPVSRWPTIAVIGVILAGIPVFYYARDNSGPEVVVEAQG
jgi:hypothetical protein